MPCNPQGVDDFGVAQPPRAWQLATRQTLPAHSFPESIVQNFVGVCGCPDLRKRCPVAAAGSRRNVVTAVGVTLSEAPGAPPGARCTSASRRASTAACGQASTAACGEAHAAASGCGMLSETFICRETFEPRVWVTARTALHAATGCNQAGARDGELHDDRPGRSGQQRTRACLGAERSVCTHW